MVDITPRAETAPPALASEAHATRPERRRTAGARCQFLPGRIPAALRMRGAAPKGSVVGSTPRAWQGVSTERSVRGEPRACASSPPVREQRRSSPSITACSVARPATPGPNAHRHARSPSSAHGPFGTGRGRRSAERIPGDRAPGSTIATERGAWVRTRAQVSAEARCSDARSASPPTPGHPRPSPPRSTPRVCAPVPPRPAPR